jgi:Fe(II)/alpha-ketoglutarate-dependent arginine beta-hydroxylase
MSATVTAPLGYRLAADELEALAHAAALLRGRRPGPGDAAFYDLGWELLEHVPRGLRRFLDGLRRTEANALAVVSGFPLDDAAVGPTPAAWRAAADCATEAQEIWLALTGMVLGEPFSWSTLQAGRLIGNVLPIRGEEGQQSGHGSRTLLEWHTEDGFHPGRCDYLLLMGIRNHDRVPTTVASVRDVELSRRHRETLAGRRYLILPDDEHVRQLAASDPGHPGLAAMRRLSEHPEPVAVLSGDLDRPYLRIDPFFMRCADESDAQAREALKVLIEELERVQQDVVVEPGSVLIVDNFLAVHGRRAFTARYDGTDRWIKKLTVARDLRRSRGIRLDAGARVLYDRAGA